jgi:hypothetical protein
VLGVDLWNGTPTQLTNFRNSTGATYPLLLNGSDATGGNVTTLYGDLFTVTYDNFVVVDMRDQTITYHAMTLWPFRTRYHPDEIREAVDAIVNDPVAIGPGPGHAPGELRIKASPNPFRGQLRVELNNPSARPEHGRVVLLDIRGRKVATVFDGVLAAGPNRFEWSANRMDGRLPTGVYLLRAIVGDRRIQKRVVYLP